MKGNTFTKFFYLLIFIIPVNFVILTLQVSNAQLTEKPEDNIIENLFKQAAKKHKKDFVSMGARRGAEQNPLLLKDASAKSISEILSVKIKHTNDYDIPNVEYPDHTAILFYSYEQGYLQIWLIDKNGIQGYQKTAISDKALEDKIFKVRSLVTNRFLQFQSNPKILENQNSKKIKQERFYSKENIKDLADILLPKTITDKLQSVKHLIIIPTLGIGITPYSLFQPFNNNDFLINRMSISIAPSLYDLDRETYPWSNNYAFDNPLIIGNPDLPHSKKWLFAPLPEAENEVKKVAEIMKSQALIGKEATKQTVISKAKESTLLYFATHGLSDSKNPLLGGFLALSANNIEDGFWTAREIQKLNLELVQLAVLSACQTGLGEIHDAGIIGLARAFQIAGVRRVVMSLWNVDDQATSELMQEFVKNLYVDIPAEALKKAVIKLQEKYPNEPSKWSSFVFFGTPR